MSVIYAAQQEARESADTVLRELWNEELYPVDPFEIASQLGIKVLYGDLPQDVSGMLRAHAGEVVMYIDTDDHPRRQRFTAAHELGHYFQRKSRDATADIAYIDRRSDLASKGSDPSEVWANEFAASLLMPAAVVRRLAWRGLDEWDMAKFFDVSPAAMTFRMRNLGLAQ